MKRRWRRKYVAFFVLGAAVCAFLAVALAANENANAFLFGLGALLLAYQATTRTLNSTLIRLDGEELYARTTPLAGSRRAEFRSENVVDAQAKEYSDEEDSVSFVVEIRQQDGATHWLLTTDTHHEARYIADAINGWLRAHRGEDG